MHMTDGELFRRRASDAQNVMHGRVRVAPPTSWKATNALLVGLPIAALIFASTVQYARTVEARGSVLTDIGSPTVSAQGDGTVTLLVREGDRVREGQPLARTVLRQYDDQGDLSARRADALQAEISFAEERARNARAAGQAQADAYAAQADSARRRIADLNGQMEEARLQTRTAIADLDRARAVAERGFISRRDLEAREAQVSSRRQVEGEIAEKISQASGEAQMAMAEATRARGDAEVTAGSALEGASRARMLTAEREAGRTSVLISPSAGNVAALPVRNGQSVRVGEPVAIVMPHGARLVAQVDVPASAMTDIARGQDVNVAVDAYPYQTFGTLRGRVTQVSRAAIQSGKGPVYRLEIAIPQTVASYGRSERLLPGMTISARIRTRERTMLEWLLDPILAVSRR